MKKYAGAGKIPVTTKPSEMPKDYSNQNLQGHSFVRKELIHANFHGADLRGADLSEANLTGADFSKAKTGIRPVNAAWIFLVAILVSVLSGYVSMVAGKALHHMLWSSDPNVRATALVSLILIFIFIAFSIWKGVGRAIYTLVFPVTAVAILIGIAAKITGAGTGEGMLFLCIYCYLVAIMFVIGTMARVAGGVLSSTILFLIVALSGGMFGRSIGGGIGAVVMALSCAQISKRALKGAPGFETLRKIAYSFTRRFGTSFRGSILVNADFSNSRISNSDFTGADLQGAHWENSKKQNCIQD